MAENIEPKEICANGLCLLLRHLVRMTLRKVLGSLCGETSKLLEKPLEPMLRFSAMTCKHLASSRAA